jgi:hypothetical protein
MLYKAAAWLPLLTALLLPTVAVASVAQTQEAAPAASRPHVIMIVIDDLVRSVVGLSMQCFPRVLNWPLRCRASTTWASAWS